MGYDGVIFKNICDDGGQGVEHSDVADYIAVAFDSAQVKSADPVTYDDNGEIIPLSERFSESKDIRFQVADTVEETKDLVAVHNLSEEKLMKSLELGGMPMPSIAVMKAKNNHHDFGNISLVFSKDTIDPEKGAKVWTGDAYTPTFPRVEYKLSDKATDVYMTALDLQRSGMVDNFRSIRFDPDNMFDRLNNLDFEDLIRKELQDDSTKMLYLYDTTGTVDAVELENIDKSNFEKWTRNLYESIIEKKGIKNNRDIYTSSGNRRSWEALHYEYNLENIVRAMKEKGTQGIGAFGSTITGASKVEFNSVEDIKNNRDKLLDKTSPEIKKAYDETRKGITDRFYELARSLPKYDNFTAIDDAAEMLTEAVLKFKTKTGMDNYIRNQCEGWANYSPSIVDDLLDIVNELRSLPAAYFEAKPQRGVSFNEVYTAVIPDNASAELKSALDKAGVKYQTYEAGNEEDRVRVINSLDEVKFQISDTTLTPEQQAEIERKAQRREMAKLERENENLKAALALAKKQTKISKDFRHDESETARIANRLIKQLSVVDLTESEKSEFIAKLDALYAAMDDAKLENSGGSDVIYMAALDAVDVIRDSIKYTEKYEALADRAQEFADYFKGRTYISQAQAAELRHHFGGVDKANQVVHGLNFAIAKGNETTLDMRWNELQEMFSDFIEQGVTTDADEPLAVIKAMQDARELIDGTLYSPFDENRLQERAEIEELGSIYAAEQETVNDLAMKLIDSYTDAEWKATYADKAKGRQQVQLIRQRQELRQRMEKYRAQVNDRNIAFREKLQSEYRKKYDRAVSRNDVRVETEKQRLAEYKQRVAESRKKATERKRQTELKNKIKKIALELGSMAANPNKKKKIPNGLVNITHEFLSMIETGDVTQEKLNHYVASMRAEFKEVEKSHLYESVMDNYNSIIRDMLDELETGGDNLQLKQLSAEKLEKVLNIARTLKQSVSFMNKFFFVDRNRTVSDYQNSVVAERKGKVNLKPKEFLQPLKDFAINELKPVYFFENTNSPTMLKLYEGLRRGQTIWSRDMQEAKAKEEECRERYGYNQWDLRKKYKFKLAGGEAHEVELNLLQIMSLKAYSEREAGINHLLDGGFKLRSGSEQRRYVSDKFKRVIDKTAYRITEDELNQIISTLTPEQVAYCYEMREYLSTDLSKKGNEISRQMWDIELFTEEKYFPIKTDGDFNKMGELAVVDGKKLKNWGASKPLVPHAHNPLVLEEFNDVWSRHCKEMAEYHSFTLPLEDFQKVYGYFHVLTASQEKELRKNYSDEVAFEHAPGAAERKQLLGGLFEAPVATVSIRSLFTDAEQRYIAQFLRDLNGGVKKADETLPSRGISKYKKMATALNLRVTVQQPGAIARAFTYISPKYFAMTTGSGLKGIKSDSAAVQEMEKYSDAAFIKSLGYFDIDTGRTAEQYLNENNYSTFRQKAKGFALDGEYRDEKMMFAPEMADRITWLHIWAATKAKVEAEEHLTGEALLKRAGEVFNNVVDKTQVYDSVFTRSGHMRSTSVLAKMATSFLAEPTTTLNMYVNAITQWKRGNVKKSFVAKAFASCLTATFLTNLLASVVSAMRHGKDDDNWWELWVGEFTADFLTDVTMVNSIPLVRDIFSLAKGWDVERADMTLVANWIDSVKKLNQAQQNDEVTYKEWLSFCSSSAVLLGMPLGSLQKDLFGIFQAAKVLSNGTAPTTTGFKKAIVSGVYDAATIDDMLALPQPSTNKYDMIYQLYAAGNTKEAEKRKEILFKYDDKADQNKLDNYIKAQLQENKDVMSAADALQEGDLGAAKAALSKIKNFDEAIILKAVVATVNSRVDEESDEVTEDTLLKLSPQKSLEQNLLLNNKTIRKAAVALNNNDDEARYNLQSQLVSQGFSVNDVINVTKQVKAKMFPSEKKEESSTKEAKLFQYTDVADALKANNATFAKKVMKDLVEAYAKEGKSEEDVKKQVRAKITATFKQEYYMASESRRAEIRILMWKSGAYDNSDAVLKVCNGWVKQIAKKKFG